MSGLEERIKSLEEENARLQALPRPQNAGVDKNMIVEYISNRLPKTYLLSPKFFTRAEDTFS